MTDTIKKIVLAVDSSDTPLKLALLCPDGRMLSAISSDVRQERNVVKLARRLLSTCGLGLSDVDRVFALRGPGRFTGIRIGLTLASVMHELNNAEVCSATVLETLARQSEELAAMDFTLLFDRARDLFSIGFNVAECRCDPSFYDLLASEARLCSYVAIALGQVPQDHWFSLGRLLIALRGEPILVSWSGSMFEYLMPLLVNLS